MMQSNHSPTPNLDDLALDSEPNVMAVMDGPSPAARDGSARRHALPSPAVSLVLSVREYFLLTLASTPLVGRSVAGMNALLRRANVPEESLLTDEELVLSSAAMAVALVGYYFLFGKRHVRRRKRLAEELKLAQRRVHVLEEKQSEELRSALRQVRDLEEKLLVAKREDMLASPPNRPPRKSKEVRIFMDGAFDVMHYGHMNAFRLGRSLGTHLIVGVNSDESIAKCKGPPLMNDDERLTMVEGCKFVDEVVPNIPYVMTPEYLDYIFDTYDVDYVVHGDDPCIVDGKDVYAMVKRRGRYRSIPRTEGVSTTDIVGRMLLMTKDHHMLGKGGDEGDNEVHGEHREEDDASVLTAANYNDGSEEIGPLGRQSKFLTTSMMLRLFSAGVKHPEEGMKVVYVDGAWDMFHCGHVKFLKEASKRGDYLIVGIHGDSLANRRRGGNLPLMNLHERVLSVLGCKYIDDVLIDAPLEITPDMIASLRITEVLCGTESDVDDLNVSMEDDDDLRYRYPKEMGIFTTIKSPSKFKLQNILSRIQAKQTEFQSKIDRKKKAEREWFNSKYQNGGRAMVAATGREGKIVF